MYHFFLAMVFLLIPAQTTLAGPMAKGQHYDARIAVQSLSAKPGNQLNLALVIRPEPGWHIYWSNPGESGYAPTLKWALPAGMKAGVLHHPAPQLLMLGGIASNVHEGEAILLQSLSVPPTMNKGRKLALSVDIDMLVCSEASCVPDPLHIELGVPVGAGHIDPAQSALFQRAYAKIPQPVQAGARFQMNTDNIRVFIPGISLGDGNKAHLFGTQNNVMSDGAAQTFIPAEGGLIVTVSAGDNPTDNQLSGVLCIDSADGIMQAAYAFDATPSERLPAMVGGDEPKMSYSGFFLAFGAAILGGILLNLMPCVFPILSLKALALASAGGDDDHKAKVEAVGYSVGAIGMILALGATLLLLRSGGQALGWAFQLQNSHVVIMLLLLVTAIATNLAGLYELPSFNVNGRAQSGFAGAMSTGALAAFIATPCTGPFMASALGAAILLPAAAAMAIFFGLGLGLALPFLALGFIKPMRKWLPRPGAWMQTLRQILSIPMFATALGLAWIVGRQGGVNLMAVAMGAALLLSLSLWWYGLRQFSGKRIWPVLVPVVMALLVTVYPSGGNTDVTVSEMGAEPFAKVRLAELRTAHTPVFLYLTADWCLTCKVNEATSLSSSTVTAAFHKAGVTVMRGDWTRGDPEITAFLKEVGSVGVPVYLWYPENGKSQKLPQILTPTLLTGLVETAK